MQDGIVALIFDSVKPVTNILVLVDLTCFVFKRTASLMQSVILTKERSLLEISEDKEASAVDNLNFTSVNEEDMVGDFAWFYDCLTIHIDLDMETCHYLCDEDTF